MTLLTIQNDQVLMSHETHKLWRDKYGDFIPQIYENRVFIGTQNRQVFIDHETLEIIKLGTLIVHTDENVVYIRWNSIDNEILLPGEKYMDPETLCSPATNSMLQSKHNFEFMEITDKKTIHYVPFVLNKNFIHKLVVEYEKIICQEKIGVETHSRNYMAMIPFYYRNIGELFLKADTNTKSSNFMGVKNYRYLIYRS